MFTFHSGNVHIKLSLYLFTVINDAGVDSLELKNHVLSQAYLTCKDVDTRNILRKLLAQEMISLEDKQLVEHEKTTADKVEKLIDILQRKQIEAYFYFMEFLKDEHSQMYTKLKDAEMQKLQGLYTR